MTWRIAVTTGHFLPVDPERPVLNRIDAPDEEIDAQRLAEEERQAAADHASDPKADIHLLGIPNEGMMAGQPTNCYLLGKPGGDGPLTIVDAGGDPEIEVFRHAFEESGVDPQRVIRIVLTHCHPDHVVGAEALRDLTGAPVYAPILEREQAAHFAPELEVDEWLTGDEPVQCEGFELRPIFTPGHSPGHLCFVETLSNSLLAGDMISGFGSVGIFPPNGSMIEYFASLRRLLAENDRRPFSAILPGHGPVAPDARAKIEEYIAHRLHREQTVYNALAKRGTATVDDLFPDIYPDILPHLGFAGKATITAHLDKLVVDGRVLRDGDTYRMP